MLSRPKSEKSKPVSKPAPGLTRTPSGLKVQTRVKATGCQGCHIGYQ